MAVGLDSMLNTLGLSRAFAERLGASIGTGGAGRTANVEAMLYTMYASLDAQGRGTAANGSGIPPQGWVPGPADYLGSALTPGAPLPIDNGFGSLNRPNALGSTQLQLSMQAAAVTDPQFAREAERAFGGRMVGPAPNGGVLVWRPQVQRLGQTTRSMFTSPPIRGSIQSSLGNMNVNLTPQTLNSGSGGILRGLQQMEANIASFAQGMGTPGGAGGMDPAVAAAAQQAGVNPQNPRFEELVFLQMLSYTSKKEKEIMGKVNDMNSGQAQNPGFFGGLTDTVGGTTARGFGVDVPSGEFFPQLAGGAGVQGQAPATGAAGIPGMAGTGALPGMEGAAGAGGVVNPNGMSETAKQQMLQKMMGDLQKLYEMLSNMMKSMHEMQMTPIRNLKG